MKFKNTQYIITVERLLGTEDGFSRLSKHTKFACVGAPDQKLKLKSTKDVKKNVFSENFTLEGLGIGGLDT